MKRSWLYLLALLAGVVFFCASGCKGDDDDDAADDDDAGDDDTQDDHRFDGLIELLQAELAAGDASAVSVAIMEDGEIVFAEAFGSAHPEEQVPVTPDTLFNVASQTKMFTAAALLQKVEAGEVALDDTLDVVLPELEFAADPTWPEQIQVQHLLTHQGAFYDVLNWQRTGDDADLANYAYGDFADQYFLMAPPGKFYNYSNPNFSFAGLVTEELDDRAWPDIVHDEILTPLGMDRSYARVDEVAADGDYTVGLGYAYVDGNWEWGPVELEHFSGGAFARPAAGLWTTPSQLLLFVKFLMEGNEAVLGDEYREAMFAPQVNTLDYLDFVHYGYGLGVNTAISADDVNMIVTPTIYHGGQGPAHSTDMIAFPELGSAFAMATNTRDFPFFESFMHIVDLLLAGQDTVELPALPFDEEQLAEHVGLYEDPYDVTEGIVIQHEGELYANVPGVNDESNTQPLVSSGSTKFLIGGDWVTFVPDETEPQSRFIRNRFFVIDRAAQSGRGDSRAWPVPDGYDPVPESRDGPDPRCRPGTLLPCTEVER